MTIFYIWGFIIILACIIGVVDSIRWIWKDTIPQYIIKILDETTIDKRELFYVEFNRRKKNIILGYCTWLFGFHYAYVNNYGMLFASWLTGHFGLVLYFADFFRMYAIIKNYNQSEAIKTFNDIK